MPPSVYVLHRTGQLVDSEVEEGIIFPLLKVLEGNKTLTWAFAVPRRDPKSGDPKEIRKNFLVIAALKALGFEIDPENEKQSEAKFDFLYCTENALESIPINTTFDQLTFPDIPTTSPSGIVTVEPKDKQLKTQSSATVRFSIKSSSKINVLNFAIDTGIRYFELGSPGSETNPSLNINVALNGNINYKFQELFAVNTPRFTFAQMGIKDYLKVNSSPLVANNSTSVPNDLRHDRLTTEAGTLICQKDSLGKINLALEWRLPSITILPASGLPVSVSIGSEGLCVRHTDKEMLFHLNRLHPSLRITVRGSIIHGDPGSIGSSEWLPLIEPAERKIGDAFESFNDFLTYGFEIGLLDINVKILSEDQIIKIEDIKAVIENILTNSDVYNSVMQLISQVPENFDFAFTELGLPNLTMFQLRIKEINGKVLSIEPPKEFKDYDLPNLGQSSIKPIVPSISFFNRFIYFFSRGIVDREFRVTRNNQSEDYSLWSIRLKKPNGLSYDLPLKSLIIENESLKATLNNDFRTSIDKLDIIELEWKFQVAEVKYDSKVSQFPSFFINNGIPVDRIPKVSGYGQHDFRLLKIRLRTPEFDLGTFPVVGLKSANEIQFDIPDPEIQLGRLKKLIEENKNLTLEIAIDLSFSLSKCFLTDLLGELPSVDFRLSVPDIPQLPEAGHRPRSFKLSDVLPNFGSLNTPIIPFELGVRLPHPTLPRPQWDEIKLEVGLQFDLSTMRLKRNRIYFFMPQRRGVQAPSAPMQVVDFDIFTLTFPTRPDPLYFPTEKNHDGYIDLSQREFVIDLKYESPIEPPPSLVAFFPGGVDKEAARLGLEGIKASGKEKVEKGRLSKELTRRFQLQLKPLWPKLWPEKGDEGSLLLRLSAKGLTMQAELIKTQVEIDTTGTEDKSSPQGLVEAFKLDPKEKEGELNSRVVIIDNELREASVYASTFVPGVKNLLASVEVSLKQTQRGRLPDVVATMKLQQAGAAPIAKLSIEVMQLQLDRLELGLVWHREQGDWDYKALVDGTIAFTEGANMIPDLEGLKAPSIRVVGLDLRRMNLKQISIPFKLENPVKFDILNGLFGVELHDLEISWEWDGKSKPVPRRLACSLARFSYKDPGTLEVHVSAGGLNIVFDSVQMASILIPSRLGIEIALSTSARFSGEVGWIDDETERYFFASGTLALEGFPEVTALLKFGTGLKDNGQRQINMVLYGGTEGLDSTIYPGLVVKGLGAGIGLNNRLKAIPPRPSADAILSQIDKIKPGKNEAWVFVREGGFYLSIVGSLTIASNPGGLSMINAYVAQFVFSLDETGIVAAGKLWLASSLKGVLAHPNNPALVGAIVLSPKDLKLQIAVASRPDPYIESNELLRKLLNSVRVRLSFRMAPGLVDYFLEELSYQQEMFGVTLKIAGSYRFAIFQSAVLMRADLTASGRLVNELRVGPGGIKFYGDVRLAIGYGGLLTLRGAMAYAYLNASVTFGIEAWIEIGFSKSFKIFGERFTISWSITFRLRAPSLELTLRGNIGLSDRNGLIGIDCLVGININICGYALRASGRLTYNAGLYEEVRARVAAFEQLLNNYISPKQAFNVSLVTSVGGLTSSLSDKVLAKFARPRSETESSLEEWLHYYRPNDGPDQDYHLFLPRSSEKWLTPVFAQIEQMEIKGENGDKKLYITSNGHNLKFNGHTKIKIVGLRSLPDKGDISALNGLWTLEEISDQTCQLSREESIAALAKTYKKDEDYSGGIWLVLRDGVPAEQQNRPQFLDDVQRIVIRLGDWKEGKAKKSSDNELLISLSSHGLKENDRILVKVSNIDRVWQINDFGGDRSTNYIGIEDVTAKILSVSTDTFTIQGSLQISNGNPSIKFATAKELLTFWNSTNQAVTQFSEQQDNAVMMETAAPSGESIGQNLLDHSAYEVLFDPRYASADRHWMALEDQFRLPDGVLSTRFRPLEELSDELGDQELMQARAYEQARENLRRQEMHGGTDLEPTDELHQSRAKVTKVFIEELSHDAGPQTYVEQVINKDDPNRVIGLFIRLNQGLDYNDEERVFVRRTGQSAKAIKITAPDDQADNDQIMSQITRLPIRQDFVIDQDATKPGSKEKSRIAVKLPLRFSDNLLRLNIEQLGRIQIFRRFPWQNEPVLLRDFIHPDISLLQNPVTLLNLSGQLNGNSLTVAENPEVTERIRGHFVILDKSISGTLESQQAIYRISEIAENGDSIKLILHDHINGSLGPKSSNGSNIRFGVSAAGSIVPSPYIFSDTFELEGRQFTDLELVSRGIDPSELKIAYSIRIVPHGEPGGTVVNAQFLKDERDKGRLADWDPVQLYVPEPDPFPKRLGLAISVESLLVNQAFTFQLLGVDGESPSLAKLGDRPFRVEDFELWASENPLVQSGFFAGADTSPSAERVTDNSTVTLNDVPREPQFESTDGKFRLEVKKNGSSGVFQIVNPDNKLRLGMGYRLYIRPALNAELSLLSPLQLLLVRKLPDTWDGSVRYRSTQQVERFTEGVKSLLERGRVELTQDQTDLLRSDEFFVDDIFQDGRNTLRVGWKSRSLFDGGVELVFQDFDDSGLVSRQTCEVLEEDEYRESRRNFANASYWDFSRTSRRERIDRAPIDRSQQAMPDLNKVFLWQDGGSDIDNNPLIKNLNDAWDQLGSVKKNGSAWNKLVQPTLEFVARLYQFSKSTLNLHQPIVEQSIEAILRLLRLIFVGMKPPPDEPTSANLIDYNNKLREAEEALRKKIVEIEEAAPADMTTNSGGEDIFLDRDVTKRLAGIVRRRFAIGDDVVSLIGGDNFSMSLKEEVGSDQLPRQTTWDRLINEAKSFLSNLNEVATRLPLMAAIEGFVTQEALANLHEHLKKILKEILLDAIKNTDSLARVQRQAAGLAELLKQLQLDDKSYSLLKRPHHELLTTTDETTGEIKAQSTLLNIYLPDDARLSPPDQLPPLPNPRLEVLGIRVARLATLDSTGTLKVWTANGVDPSATELKLFQVIHKAGGSQVSLAYDDNQQYALVWGSGSPKLWNLLTGDLLQNLSPNGSTDLTKDACFAETAFGLEIITTMSNNVQIWNRSQDLPRSTFKQNSNGSGRRITSVIYEPRQRLVIAGSDGGTIMTWQDIGKGDQETFRLEFKIGDGEVSKLLILRVPEGIRVAAIVGGKLAITTLENNLSLINPPLPDGTTICSLAFDGLGLRLAAGTTDGHVLVWPWGNLNNPVKTKLGVNSNLIVDFLRSENKSYLVTYSSTQEFCSIRQESIDSSAKTLTNQFSVETQKIPVANSVTAISSSLMPAITSSASRGVVGFTNLWERMGFALDVSMVDNKNQLKRLVDLRKAISSVLNKQFPNQINGIDHDLYTFLPQEPDGDYRKEDKVGLSFMKVAVVPRLFHNLCLNLQPTYLGGILSKADGSNPTVTLRVGAPESLGTGKQFILVVLAGKGAGKAFNLNSENPYDPLTKTLNLVNEWNPEDRDANTSIVALVDLTQDSALRQIAKWLDFRSVQLLVPQLATAVAVPLDTEEQQSNLARTVIELLYVQQAARYIGLPDPSTTQGSLVSPSNGTPTNLLETWVEPQTERWLVVPASGGRSRSIWDAPDRRGHRFSVSVRRISRYEPLVRWWLQQNKPIEILSDVVVAVGKLPEQDASNESLKLATAIPKLQPHQYPLRVEITSGIASGQHRVVVNYDSTQKTLKIDPGDPWLTIPSEGDGYRVLAPSDFSKLIEIPPTLDEERGEGSRPLTVYQYPHSTRVQFSYQIPPQGARSIYNQISKVRTGFRGVDLVFRYLLLDRDAKDPQCIDKLVAAIELVSGNMPTPLSRIVDIEVNDRTRLRLFRHERLITLPNLPFFYRYRLDVRSQFESRQLERNRLTDAEMLPRDPNLSPPAERRPRRLKIWQPTITKLGEGDRQFKIELYLSKVADHLTLVEQRHEPQPLMVKFPAASDSKITIPAGLLPDCKLDYGLFCLTTNSASPDASDIFVQVGWLRLPWSKSFRQDDDQSKTKPYIEVSTGLKIRPTDSTDSSKDASKLSLPIEMLKQESNGEIVSVVYRVTFELIVDEGFDIFTEPKRYFLQGSRDGVPTKAIQFHFKGGSS